jgi:6-phosphogluconolactonase/glucosamine-6-phosphate isomerase/deaminase
MATMTKNQEIKIFPNVIDLFAVAVKDFIQRATAAVSDKDVFSVVLSGGHTPKLFFDALATFDRGTKRYPGKKFSFSLVMNVMSHSNQMKATIT